MLYLKNELKSCHFYQFVECKKRTLLTWFMFGLGHLFDGKCLIVIITIFSMFYWNFFFKLHLVIYLLAHTLGFKYWYNANMMFCSRISLKKIFCQHLKEMTVRETNDKECRKSTIRWWGGGKTPWWVEDSFLRQGVNKKDLSRNESATICYFEIL